MCTCTCTCALPHTRCCDAHRFFYRKWRALRPGRGILAEGSIQNLCRVLIVVKACFAFIVVVPSPSSASCSTGQTISRQDKASTQNYNTVRWSSFTRASWADRQDLSLRRIITGHPPRANAVPAYVAAFRTENPIRKVHSPCSRSTELRPPSNQNQKRNSCPTASHTYRSLHLCLHLSPLNETALVFRPVYFPARIQKRDSNQR